jgi:pimeloyl-ACP methyl ester carboxylesterase
VLPFPWLFLFLLTPEEGKTVQERVRPQRPSSGREAREQTRDPPGATPGSGEQALRRHRAEENRMSVTTEQSGATDIRRFHVEVPDDALEDLRRRIAATRWPDKETVDDASQGTPLAKLQDLVDYWGSAYDWRKFEARLNALPQFKTVIDGVDMHFIHVTSPHEDALPLIITHGWPGSIVELLEAIGPLTDPTAHGASAADAFHVVVPSMPGYGFSERPTTAGWGPERIAQAWAELMNRLGYTRYVSQGGDWGSVVAEAMGRQAPAGLLGIHVNLPATVPAEVAAALAVGGPAPKGLSDEERSTFEKLAAGGKTGGRAYFVMLTARPQSVGYGMADSPAGLAAWMLVHGGFTQWTNSSDAERTPSKDQVLDDITLYWLTNTGTSAGRLYWENRGGSPTSAADQQTSQITLPVAITVFPGESYQTPRSWAERAYPNLIYFNQADKGGHFAAWEQPEVFSRELRDAYRSLR